ncbi:MAG: hypothetical protein IPP47_06065 [Bryobacterales bacterium]|nr:hypothetical protein [Bryobacterales bacterium]
MLSYLGEVSVRVLALGLLGWVAAWMLRRRGAAVRHAVWVAVLAGMLGLLAATAWVPEWRVVTSVVTRPAVTAEFDVVAGGDSVAAALPAAAVAMAWPDWRAVAAGLYLAVVLLLVARVLVLVRRAWGLVERAEVVEGYAVEVRESDEVMVPMTVGWRRKVVLLPAGWRAWDEFALRAVMAHEVEHVRRGDWGMSLVAALNRAVFWFHPLAWWVERRLLGLAEEACDGAAIAVVGDGRRYAEVVLGFAAVMSGAGSRLDWAATAMARSSRVGGRIERILEGEMNWTRGLTLGGWAALVLAAVPVVYGAAALRMVEGVVLEMPVAPLSLPAAVVQQGVMALPPPGGDTTLRKLEAMILTPGQAGEIEAELERNPEDRVLRAKLLQYYFAQSQGQDWARHLLWLVERHPDLNCCRRCGRGPASEQWGRFWPIAG